MLQAHTPRRALVTGPWVGESGRLPGLLATSRLAESLRSKIVLIAAADVD